MSYTTSITLDFPTYINMALYCLQAGSVGLLFSYAGNFLGELFYERKRRKMFTKPQPWVDTDWAVAFAIAVLIFLLIMAVSSLAVLLLTVTDYLL